MPERMIRYLARNNRIIKVPESQAQAFENSPLIQKRLDEKPPRDMRHEEVRVRIKGEDEVTYSGCRSRTTS